MKKCFFLRAAAFVSVMILGAFPATGKAGEPMGGGASAVRVNGSALSSEQVGQLQQILGSAIAPGDYWYDNFSGLWGYQGGPYSGQILPGLNLGGPLQADASGRGTGVFINGREIHPQEYAQLQRSFGVINPGRYWLNAQGIGGYEGGPAQFNLAFSSNGGAGAGGEPGYNVNAAGASLGSDGNCSYAMLPDGSSVMTGNC